jgi:hypothetical protein
MYLELAAKFRLNVSLLLTLVCNNHQTGIDCLANSANGLGFWYLGLIIMNRILSGILFGQAFMYAIFANAAHAGEELNAVNGEVEKRAEQIDQSYGVLLSSQERNALKISIVVRKVTPNEETITTQELVERVKKAVVTYEITDPTDQRKLLIEMEAQTQAKGTGDGSSRPDYP